MAAGIKILTAVRNIAGIYRVVHRRCIHIGLLHSSHSPFLLYGPQGRWRYPPTSAVYTPSCGWVAAGRSPWQCTARESAVCSPSPSIKVRQYSGLLLTEIIGLARANCRMFTSQRRNRKLIMIDYYVHQSLHADLYPLQCGSIPRIYISDASPHTS